MEAIITTCNGWLLIMDLFLIAPKYSSGHEHKPIIICTPTETACRRTGGEREVSLRTLEVNTAKSYSFTCTDMNAK